MNNKLRKTETWAANIPEKDESALWDDMRDIENRYRVICGTPGNVFYSGTVHSNLMSEMGNKFFDSTVAADQGGVSKIAAVISDKGVELSRVLWGSSCCAPQHAKYFSEEKRELTHGKDCGRQ